jgi:hypothetical protein
VTSTWYSLQDIISEIKIIISIINWRYRNFYRCYDKESDYEKDVGGFVDEIYVDGFFCIT